jgi:SAM-dependent MidA family methyltransferase
VLPWPRPWADAWEDALHGPDGFFRRERPLDHFRTSVAVPAFATAVRRLAERVDDDLGRPDPFDVVDLGAGRGELLASWHDVPARWRLRSVDLGDPWPDEVVGLLLGHELLDTVPCEVLEGDRLVLVDADGRESLGPVAPPEVLAWRDRWWPGGERVEVGLARDRLWADAVSRLVAGTAVAVDYGHVAATRRPTLTGYRRGAQVRPVPDGSCDLTAHVALDAVAAAVGGEVLGQRDVLRSLGLIGAAPDPALAEVDASAYLEGLAVAGQEAELLDPAGLGGFGWVVSGPRRR